MHDLTIILTLAGGLGAALVFGWITQRLGLSTLVGCASGGDDDEVAQQLTVFAAASLSGAFTEIAEEFEGAHPGVSI